MKTIKIVLLLVAFSAMTFYSCSDDSPIKNENTAQKSIALRTVLNELKTYNNIAGRSATSATPANPFCFEFAYPITVSYNNGTAVTVANLQGLLDVLSNESPSLFLEGIIFPFQVIQDAGNTTITNEEDFTALIENCGFDTINDDLLHTFCFDIVFPISITHGGQIIIIHSLEELNAYIENPNSGTEAQIVFPISVIYNNQIVVINSLYEFYQMTNNCNTCICTADYTPVCVQTATGIFEFGNFCQAQCAGYTQNDLVPCNGAPVCSISNITTTVGVCNSNATYQLVLNFDYANAGNSSQFGVALDGAAAQMYPLSALPITLNIPTNASGAMAITISGVSCSGFTQWTPPNCAGVCTCPIEHSPVCVRDAIGNLIQFENSCLAACAGFTPIMFENCNPTSTSNFGTQLGSCFQMNYPVGVQYQGAIHTVNSDSELLQYYFPATGSMPAMNYPITVTFANTIYTFANQAAFESQIAISCP